ncbi:MAG TPA: RNA 2',3'-cyclic phosphodiesterase [Dehalococcoidia bacterium]|nr:RNA 2',3'-cyclic phosphodiesterase [Dehalococcoidia bacterium]
MSEGQVAESLRLFVAIELPDAWKEALGGLQEEMRTALAKDPAVSGVRVRWVRPEGIHLTLKFLGEVDSAKLVVIREALASAVHEQPGLELSLARAGSFSDRRAPRLILATINVEGGPKRLLQLAEGVETWLAATGFPRERRAFAPHLTLARLPDNIDASLRAKVAAITTAIAVPSPPPLRVQQVSLIRSRLGRDGTIYERLAAFPS